MTLQGFLDSFWCLALVWSTMLISLGISIHLLLQHLLHYHNHRLQSYVVRILVFMPIYGALTFLLYLLPHFMDVLEMLRNIWEGLLIHSFLCLMMEYCGGESNCADVITRDPSVLKHVWPIREIKVFGLNEDIPLNVGFVKRCRMGTMQYAFIRPLLAIFSVIFRMLGIEKSLLVSIFNWVIINASVYLALYALGLFYLATRNHPGLAKANCLVKCISLKMMVVFTFYQGCIILWFTTLEQQVAETLNTVLVLLELPLFALLLQKAYCVDEFVPLLENKRASDASLEKDMEAPPQGDAESQQTSPPCVLDARIVKMCSALGLNADDIRVAISAEGREKILANASMALNMADLFSDVYHNCSDKYRQHSILPQTNNDQADKDIPAKEPEVSSEKFVESFAEFDKEHTKQNLEQKATTLAKLQFL
ncbi:Transmembrane -like protein [Babesia sp. Xinjiang]|uniref:Transmembrane -like protein n=1 Tax=Babesia sp. Xinjiang TaxID=462227 RepID=UPI000A2168E9|nr:Transmembrane -like protein [Babesia sp. Xinjiang]ORM41714.1 Transmembrane -like protein [Babesia sp. Xinjiang]